MRQMRKERAKADAKFWNEKKKFHKARKEAEKRASKTGAPGVQFKCTACNQMLQGCDFSNSQRGRFDRQCKVCTGVEDIEASFHRRQHQRHPNPPAQFLFCRIISQMQPHQLRATLHTNPPVQIQTQIPLFPLTFGRDAEPKCEFETSLHPLALAIREFLPMFVSNEIQSLYNDWGCEGLNADLGKGRRACPHHNVLHLRLSLLPRLDAQMLYLKS